MTFGQFAWYFFLCYLILTGIWVAVKIAVTLMTHPKD